MYLASHPVLFGLVSATRRAPVVRIGRTLLVHGTQEYRHALTAVPLDRTAGGTTGGTARELTGGGGVVFDEEGPSHRASRRAAVGGDDSGWRAALTRHTALLAAMGPARATGPSPSAILQLRRGHSTPGRGNPGATTARSAGVLDVVGLAADVAGCGAAALLGVGVDGPALARAAREAAAAAARAHVPGVGLPGRKRRAGEAARRLVTLTGDERGAMLAVAAVNTMVAAIPRAVAWCADDGLWPFAEDPVTRPSLVDELLRVLAPTPVLPRVAAARAAVGGRRVRRGERLVLVARHAAQGHERGPDPVAPAPAGVTQLVFGAGAHACPGARLARVQLAEVLAALAPFRPVVVRARPDRRAALPGWSTLDVRRTR
ncbi:hypothetical protein Val02_73090 [Virgisporangium aliadipatigenens]|uniref:Cytochrome P450 n=1 Tax=Virgisporangium aliadipatigenens TaxID=741659 RepID=A0A8J3YVE2_9ACTN|nr:hypothetical protein Val02_73090 [Virgisporangium aliadipatigenens]